MAKVILNSAPAVISIYFDNNKIVLSEEYNNAVERHWNELNKAGNKFARGDVYTITSVKHDHDSDFLKIYTQLSDYAHYMYTINGDYSNPLDCRVIYTSLLIKTADDYVVFGKMSDNTSTPGRLQCIGGGIDKSDIRGDFVDLNHCIINETLEEIGLDLLRSDKVDSFFPKYVKSGGKNNFLAAIYMAKLTCSLEELNWLFNDHIMNLRTKDIAPELVSLVSVPSNPIGVQAFFNQNESDRVDYLGPLLEIETGLRSVCTDTIS